jgi:hypothetical protein
MYSGVGLLTSIFQYQSPTPRRCPLASSLIRNHGAPSLVSLLFPLLFRIPCFHSVSVILMSIFSLVVKPSLLNATSEMDDI